MKLYFAGESPVDRKVLIKANIKNVLKSYWFMTNKTKEALELKNQFNLFVDSGAFSAFTKNTTINIDKYIMFIKQVNPDVYAGLDVINNAEKTLENIRYMVNQGLNPIPTFHLGSDMEFLYKMVDEFDYIALGVMAGINRGKNEIMGWLDRIWNQILQRKPDLKVHGFACSGVDVMTCYPWESVDSTSWLAPVIFGREIDGKTNRDIIQEYAKTDSFVYSSKKLQREVILTKSIQYFLRIEEQINKKHTHSAAFERTTQMDLFT